MIWTDRWRAYVRAIRTVNEADRRAPVPSAPVTHGPVQSSVHDEATAMTHDGAPADGAYRDLPSVERLLTDERVASLTARHGHDTMVDLARSVLAEYREAVRRHDGVPAQPLVDAVVKRAARFEPSLRRVINATGVVIHTNLGRAPLAPSALAAMAAAGAGYSNLEYDIEAGARGSRFTHLSSLLCRVTGAAAAIAVNNNASALVLALAALAHDREVIISRGQLVEIGGGFRIPDVMRQSGANLVEVGTTNRTYVRDYADATTERTAALLRVHASNFRVVGFTEQPDIEQLATLARERELLLIDDVGSGALLDTRPFGLAQEPLVQASVAAGADVVLFSGDKLLGGPQAGIAVGHAGSIERMQRHPLARALRMDKASIAALAATLQHYARGDALEQIPVWRMISASLDGLRERAERWASAAGAGAEVTGGRSMIGGGSLPGEAVGTALTAIEPPGGEADALAAALRAGDPAIVARIEHGRVLLDPRTVDPSEDDAVEQALRRTLAAAGAGGSGGSAGR